MGYATALDIANTALPIQEQIAIHFQANCYPPVPAIMIPLAVEAIEAYNEYDGGRSLSLPEGVTFRGHYEATAFEVIDQLKLGAWLIEEE